MTTSNRAAAREKRRPAPQRGGSSRLLKRMETPLPPASRAPATKQASATRSRLPVIGQRYAWAFPIPNPLPSRSPANDGSAGTGADANERRNMRGRERLRANRLTCLIIRLILQTIRRDPSGADQTD